MPGRKLGSVKNGRKQGSLRRKGLSKPRAAKVAKSPTSTSRKAGKRPAKARKSRM